MGLLSVAIWLPVLVGGVLLALGRRGTPRKLDVPGEESPNMRELEPLPKSRLHSIWKAGAASTFSTDCSGVPPGRGQSVRAAGAGSSKSAPLRPSAK